MGNEKLTLDEISKKTPCTEYTAEKILNALEDIASILKRIEEKVAKENI